MSWQNNLQTASFDGVAFACKQTSDTNERALALYEYPHRDGADIDDLGKKGRSFALTAIIWEKDGDEVNYEMRLQELLFSLDRTGAGDFVHPVYGAIKAQVQRYLVRHVEDRPDYVEIDITFLESTPALPFWAVATAQHKTDKVGMCVKTAQDKSTAAFAGKTPSLAARLKSLRSRLDAVDKLNRMTAQLRQNVSDVIVAGLDVLTYPSSWASDTRAIFAAIAAAPRAAAARVQGSLAGFVAIRNALWPQNRSQDALAAPVLAAAAVPGTPVVDRTDVPAAVVLQALAADLVLRERSLALAEATGELLGLEADVVTLTPAEIASMAAQSRSALQDAIESARATLSAEDAYAVVEALRDVAAAILDASQAIILSRPPLVSWPAPGAGNLVLIAHWRYGDASRAAELARLNPGVARAVFVQPGQMITGFAR